MFSEIMRYILDLGPTVMLPIVIIIAVHAGGGADKVRAVHVGLDFIDPALHQIQLNVVAGVGIEALQQKILGILAE
jgi:galactitol-specific phosphotransferase system IIC component